MQLVLTRFVCFVVWFGLSSGNVGVPIKLLFEAEGMKVTAEVRWTICHPCQFSSPQLYWIFIVAHRWKMGKSTVVYCWVQKKQWTCLCPRFWERLVMVKSLNYQAYIWEEVAFDSLLYQIYWKMRRSFKKWQWWNERWNRSNNSDNSKEVSREKRMVYNSRRLKISHDSFVWNL